MQAPFPPASRSQLIENSLRGSDYLRHLDVHGDGCLGTGFHIMKGPCNRPCGKTSTQKVNGTQTGAGRIVSGTGGTMWKVAELQIACPK